MTDLIVDANSLFARSWFAAQTISPDPPQALRLAMNTILLIINPNTNRIGHQFDRMLFCWDGDKKPDKGRAEKPPDYHPTKELLRDVLTMAFGAAHGVHPHYEADDIVGTAVAANKSEHVYIVSGDKDLMQLQTSQCIHYYSLNEKCVLSTAFINNKFHVKRPSHVAIALAIIGDPVDNIEGIKGWGPKKVQKLFADITSDMDFASVVEAIDAKVPEEHKTAFYSSLERTMINCDVQGVPEPAPIKLATPEEVGELGIPSIGFNYSEVYNAYHVPY